MMQNGPVETTELRHYDIEFGSCGKTIRRSIERSAGVELRAITEGMWVGKRSVGLGKTVEVTVRASATSDGTDVAVSIRHRTSDYWTLVLIPLALPLVLLVVPILLWAALSHRMQERQCLERDVLLHSIWSELAHSVCTPLRAGYREAPTRVLPDDVVLAEARRVRRARVALSSG